MIAALANAAMVFGEQSWLDAAVEAFDYVAGPMAAGERLRHAARHGRSKDVEFLDDYAEMARAALMLAEATGEEAYVEKARGWVAVLDAHYWDADEGGYFYAPGDGEASISRTKTAHDAATPAGNGTMVGVLARLHHLTGETAYRDRAEALVKAFSGELERNFSPLSTLANNSEVLRRAVQVVVCGTRAEEGTKALVDAVYAISLPNRVLTVLEPSGALPLGHPAFGKGQQEGQATAYVCVGPVCSLPVTEPDALRAALDHARAPVGRLRPDERSPLYHREPSRPADDLDRRTTRSPPSTSALAAGPAQTVACWLRPWVSSPNTSPAPAAPSSCRSHWRAHPSASRCGRRCRRSLTARPEATATSPAHLDSAPRAIGGACGANPIPLIVPCHRVVGAGGTLGGFSGGAGCDTKRQLLALEGALPPTLPA